MPLAALPTQSPFPTFLTHSNVFHLCLCLRRLVPASLLFCSLVSCLFPSRLSKYFVYFHLLEKIFCAVKFTFQFQFVFALLSLYLLARSHPLLYCTPESMLHAFSVSYFSHSLPACIFHLFLIYLLASKRSCSLLVTGYSQLSQTPYASASPLPSWSHHSLFALLSFHLPSARTAPANVSAVLRCCVSIPCSG